MERFRRRRPAQEVAAQPVGGEVKAGATEKPGRLATREALEAVLTQQDAQRSAGMRVRIRI